MNLTLHKRVKQKAWGNLGRKRRGKYGVTDSQKRCSRVAKKRERRWLQRNYD